MHPKAGWPTLPYLLATTLYMYTTHVLYLDLSSTTQNGVSPLYSASQEGHTDVVDFLLKSGADPNLTTVV